MDFFNRGRKESPDHLTPSNCPCPARRLTVSSAAMKHFFLTPLRHSGLCLLALSLGVQTACDKPENPSAPPAAPSQETLPAPVVDPAAAETPSPVPGPGDASPATESAALEHFKTEIAGIKAFMEANQGTNDAAAGLANLKELVSRASAVKTEGLPEDLATAYQDMTGVMQRVQTTLSGLPVPVEQLADYIQTEGGKGGAAADEVKLRMDAFKAAMETLGKEGEAASAKLKEAGTKYGIESLDLSSQ